MLSDRSVCTYEMREDDDGWTIFNVRTGETAVVDGVAQIGLDMGLADDLVHTLNFLGRKPDGMVGAA